MMRKRMRDDILLFFSQHTEALPLYEKLEEQIFGAFMSFARTGAPSQEQLPAWPEVTETEEPTMIFDRECQVRDHFDDELLKLIDSILPPFNLMEQMASQNIQH